jgi:hypothetical protein
MQPDHPTDLRSVLSRASGTIIQDMAGGVALVVMLVVGLNLSALV